jgi:hypothetical protein
MELSISIKKFEVLRAARNFRARSAKLEGFRSPPKAAQQGNPRNFN